MSIFIEQTIKNGFLITKLVPADLECVLLSLTIVNHKIPLLFTMLQKTTWMSKTLHTIIQLEKQTCFIKKLLQRQFENFNNRTVNQFIKNCQIAMHSAVVLAQKNLATSNRQSTSATKKTTLL